MPDDKSTRPPDFTAEELAEWQAYRARERSRDVPGQPPPRVWTPEEEKEVPRTDRPPELGHPDRRAEYLRSLPPMGKQPTAEFRRKTGFIHARVKAAAETAGENVGGVEAAR